MQITDLNTSKERLVFLEGKVKPFSERAWAYDKLGYYW